MRTRDVKSARPGIERHDRSHRTPLDHPSSRHIDPIEVVGDESSSGRAIEIRRLSKTFPGTVALRNVDLDLHRGEVHALVGANGSGKSTLVKILAGCEQPDPGSGISICGRPLEVGSPQASFRAGCRFVHQDLALVDTLSVADNVLLTGGWPTVASTIRSRAAAAEVSQALARIGADVPADVLLSDLSPVMRTMVAIARALRPDPHSELAALILDEPTARLSAHEIVELARCVRDLATQGSAVLIVSHHLEEVLEIADVVTVLRDGVRVFTAPAATLTRRALIAAMTGDDPTHSGPQSTTRPATQLRDSDVVLSCRGIAGLSFEDVSLDVRSGEVVGIAGLEGSGRDELLPVIFGASERLDGSVHIGGAALPPGDLRTAMSAGVAYLPADRGRSAVVAELSARENLTLADVRSISRPALVDRARERQEARTWFARFDVRPRNGIDQPLATFSGGNQQKIVLARWLRRAPRVLLLDEPTYGVDAAAQASLHASMLEAAAQGAAVVISSSDEQELATVCDRVIVLRRGTVATELMNECLSARSIAATVISTNDDSAEVGGAT